MKLNLLLIFLFLLLQPPVRGQAEMWLNSESLIRDVLNSAWFADDSATVGTVLAYRSPWIQRSDVSPPDLPLTTSERRWLNRTNTLLDRAPRGLTYLSGGQSESHWLLAPYWRVRVLTNDQTALETTNGFRLRFNSGSFSGGIRFRDATLNGEQGLLASPLFPDRNQLTRIDTVGTLATYDRLEGGLRWQGKMYTLYTVRDRLWIGSGHRVSVLPAADSPPLNQVGLQLNFSPWTLDYRLVELHSFVPQITPPVVNSGNPHTLDRPKHLAMHTLSWNHPRWQIRLTDLVVFSDQELRLGYLNPLNFFWSEEHAAGDRDNSLLAMGFTGKVRKALFWGEWLLDDLSLSRLLSDYPVNKSALAGGLQMRWPAPLLWTLETGFARPFVYTHFHETDPFTHRGHWLAELKPNSWNSAFSAVAPLSGSCILQIQSRYSIQGKGYLQADGTWLNRGDRSEYPTFGQDDHFPLLAGEKEYQLQWGGRISRVWAPRFKNRSLSFVVLSLALEQQLIRGPAQVDTGDLTRTTNRDLMLWLELEYDYGF